MLHGRQKLPTSTHAEGKFLMRGNRHEAALAQSVMLLGALQSKFVVFHPGSMHDKLL